MSNLLGFFFFNREAVIKHSLVHKVFLDFFLHAPDKQRTVSDQSILKPIAFKFIQSVYNAQFRICTSLC